MAFMKWFNEGTGFFQNKKYDKAIECWKKALEIGTQENHDRVVSNAAMNIGTVYKIKGEYDQALKYFHQCLEIERKRDNAPGITETLIKIGDVFFALEKWENARDYYEQSLEIFEGEENEKGRILHNIGLSLFINGKWKQSINFYEQSLEIFKNLEDYAGITKVLVNLGIAARNLGRWEEAISYFKQSLEIDEKLGDKYGRATCLMNIGIAFEVLGRVKEAIEYYQNSFNMFREIDDDEGIAMCLLNIGNAFQYLKKWEKSLDFYKKSVKKFKKLKDKLNISKCLTNIGIVLRNLGKWEEAISNYRKGLTWFESVNDEAALSKCLLDLGVAYYSVGKMKEAIQYFQKSRELFQQLGDRPGEALACQNLGWAYQEQKKIQFALKHFNDALGIYTTLITPISSEEYRESYEREFSELPKIIKNLAEMLKQPAEYISTEQQEEGVDSMNKLLSELMNNVTELNSAIKTHSANQDISKNISGLMDLVNKTLVTFSQSEKIKSEKVSKNIFESINICNQFLSLFDKCVINANYDEIVPIFKDIQPKLVSIYPELDLPLAIQEIIGQITDENRDVLSENEARELKYLILNWIKRLYTIALSNRKLYLETVGGTDEITRKLESELNNILIRMNQEEYNYSTQVLGYLIITKTSSGIPLYQWNFIEATFSPELVGGFLSAIQSFGSEITRGSTSMEKLAYKNFEINFQDGKYVRCALILQGSLTELLTQRLKKFVLAFETQFEDRLKTDSGNISVFKTTDSLIEKYFK